MGARQDFPLELGSVPLRKPDASVNIGLQYREKAENRINKMYSEENNQINMEKHLSSL